MNKIDIKNPNHIKFKHDKLEFEILGGINSENYHSLRVMLITALGRNKHRDNVDLLNHEQTTSYIKKVAEATGLHPTKVKLAFDELINELEEYKLELQNNFGKPIVKSYQLLDKEREQAIEILKQPNLLSTINNMISEAGVIGNETNRIILFLTYLTRKRNESLHAVIQSQFNYLQNKLITLLPEEETYELSYVSENTLFYFIEEELQKKVVFVEDVISDRKKLKPLISFQLKNQLTKTTVTKNEYAQLVTVQKRVKGNISLSISTREEQAFADNGVLSFVIQEETGEQQDDKMLLYQRKQSAGLICPYNEQKIIKQIQNLQRVLSSITVINPFAMLISLPQQIKNKQVTNSHYLKFIEVITFFKQYQRERKVNEDTGEEYIETTLEDIKEANQLLSEILVNKSDSLNKPTRLYLEHLKSYLATRKTESEIFTLYEIAMTLQVPKTTVTRYNKTLLETGFISATSEGNKKDGYQYQLINASEYNELKTSINNTMCSTIVNIENQLSKTESKTTTNQNENGTLNVLENNTIDEVDHNPTEGTQSITTNKTSNTKKKVA